MFILLAELVKVFTQALQILHANVLLDLADQDFSINLHQHLGLLLLKRKKNMVSRVIKAPLHELLRLCKCIVKLTVRRDLARHGQKAFLVPHFTNIMVQLPSERFPAAIRLLAKKQDGLLWVQVQIVKRHLQIALHLFNLFAVYLFKIVVGTLQQYHTAKIPDKAHIEKRLCFLLHCAAALPIDHQIQQMFPQKLHTFVLPFFLTLTLCKLFRDFTNHLFKFFRVDRF